LDWRKMLFEAETTLCSQIANLKFQFETLDWKWTEMNTCGVNLKN
jgi:hypothetical protein